MEFRDRKPYIFRYPYQYHNSTISGLKNKVHSPMKNQQHRSISFLISCSYSIDTDWCVPRDLGQNIGKIDKWWMRNVETFLRWKFRTKWGNSVSEKLFNTKIRSYIPVVNGPTYISDLNNEFVRIFIRILNLVSLFIEEKLVYIIRGSNYFGFQ